ncbi:hypothetical protein BH23CHL2_BH23CHL2_11150 [soil metagenome]
MNSRCGLPMNNLHTLAQTNDFALLDYNDEAERN